ncbi:hypothetical protein GPJ56_001983 [Histomonas meleagridis]|uniref:uncharacterized protein n=1 Tax=Histomonas meleagridis TaxID=135588 RepID=UPI0035594AA1|nr:hypothetical protein GPJ56_001983 [Histomonas meleagridis]KAH0800941.1 hypothetical protein GO595_006257 [Histomonas meleagridis]
MQNFIKSFYNRLTDEEFIQIGNQLLISFNTYGDRRALKVFTSWCYKAKKEILEAIADDILQLYFRHQSIEVIHCVASLCYIDPQKYNQVGIELLDKILFICKNAPERIGYCLDSLPFVSKSAGHDHTLNFLVQTIDQFCSRENIVCLISKEYLLTLASIGPDVAQFEDKIGNFIMSLLSSEEIKFSSGELTTIVSFIPYLTGVFPNFEGKYLKFFVGFAFDQLKKIEEFEALNFAVDFYLKEALINLLADFLNTFDENIELFTHVYAYFLEKFKCEKFYIVVVAFAKLYEAIVESSFFGEQKKQESIHVFPQLVKYCYEFVLQYRKNGNELDIGEYDKLIMLIKCLCKIIQEIFVPQIVKDNFIDINYFDFETLPDFLPFYAQCCALYITHVPQDDVVPQLVMTLMCMTKGSNLDAIAIAIHGLSIFFSRGNVATGDVDAFVNILFELAKNKNIFNECVNDMLRVIMVTSQPRAFLESVIQIAGECNNFDLDAFLNFIDTIKQMEKNDELCIRSLQLICGAIRNGALSNEELDNLRKILFEWRPPPENLSVVYQVLNVF